MPILLRHLAAFATLVFTTLPAFEWIRYAWQHSPDDRSGPWFALLAGAWWLTVIAWPTDRRHNLDLAALPLLAAAVAFGAFGQFFDINLFRAASGILIAWTTAWLILGGTVGLLLLPTMAIGLLSLPTTSFLINEAWLSTGFASPGALPTKVVISIALVWLGLFLLYRCNSGKPVTVSAFGNVLAVFVLVTAAGLLFTFKPPQFGSPVRLDESQWVFGNWIGAEIDASPSERRLYGAARLSKRVYADTEGGRVAVLIVESKDVHQLHAPEYCLGGSGWAMDQRASGEWAVPGGEAVVAWLTASRAQYKLQSVYWFSSDARSTTDLAGLRLRSRLSPDETFTLYMVTAIDGGDRPLDDLLDQFLDDAPWTNRLH